MSRKSLIVALSAIMAVSTAGCSKNSGGTGTLRVGASQQLTGVFNPLYATTKYDQWVGDLVYQSMLRYDADSQSIPLLVKELPEISDDGKTIRFDLRPNLTFSDGSVLDGDDVRFTFTLLADPAYAGGALNGQTDFIEGYEEYEYDNADSVSGIEVSQDKQSVTFHLSSPDIDAAETIGSIPILPDDQFNYAKGDLDAWQNLDWDELIGSGPYVLDTYEAGSDTRLVFNKNYSGPGDYAINTVLIHTYQPGEEVDALKEGTIDLLPDQIQPSIVGPASMIDSLQITSYPRAAMGCLCFNTQNGPTSEVEVRQALAYAFDRQSFVDQFYQWPEGEVSEEIAGLSAGYVPMALWSPVAPGLGDVVTGLQSMESLDSFDYNPLLAGQLLDQAGWEKGKDGIREKKGKKLTIQFAASENNAVLDAMLPDLVKAWKDLGVEVKKTTMDFNTLIASIDPQNDDSVNTWNCFFLAMTFDGMSNTVMNQIEGYRETKNGNVPAPMNFARIIDKDLNSALIRGKSTENPAESIASYMNAMVIASWKAPYVPVYANTQFDICSKRIHGLDTGPMRSWPQALDGASVDES